MGRQNDTVTIFVLRQDRSPVEEGHLEQNNTKCSEKGGVRILDARSTTTRSGQVADRTVQPSTLGILVDTDDLTMINYQLVISYGLLKRILTYQPTVDKTIVLSTNCS